MSFGGEGGGGGGWLQPKVCRHQPPSNVCLQPGRKTKTRRNQKKNLQSAGWQRLTRHSGCEGGREERGDGGPISCDVTEEARGRRGGGRADICRTCLLFIYLPSYLLLLLFPPPRPAMFLNSSSSSLSSLSLLLCPSSPPRPPRPNEAS